MSKSYLQMKIDGRKAYVRADSLNKLREVNAIVFDCDGVLIDIRESCNRAISEAVTYIIRQLTGLPLPKNLVSREIVYLFKRSGGFNNDWDLAYATLIFILIKLPRNFQEALKKAVDTSRSESDLLKYFLSVKEGVRKECGSLTSLDEAIANAEEELKKFADASDPSGIASIEKTLQNLQAIPKNFNEYYVAVKDFLSYPGGVGESLLTTVFEEIYCGSQLFKDVYACDPRFYQGQGLVKNERVIILPETLNQLSSMIGRANFGISSGRLSKLADYVLKGLLKKFNSKALVFFDDIERARLEKMRKRGRVVNLKKPDPFSLFQSCKQLEPFKFALYVGDSMEDVIMVREANKVDPRFLFVGVYEHSDFKDEIVNGFLEAESEVIIPSVNELPVILKTSKENS